MYDLRLKMLKLCETWCYSAIYKECSSWRNCGTVVEEATSKQEVSGASPITTGLRVDFMRDQR